MGIEKLNSAAWAAGFAMAACEDAYEDEASSAAASSAAALSAAARAADSRWRPGTAVMLREPRLDRADWVRAVLGLFGRRAPVSPA